MVGKCTDLGPGIPSIPATFLGFRVWQVALVVGLESELKASRPGPEPRSDRAQYCPLPIHGHKQVPDNPQVSLIWSLCGALRGFDMHAWRVRCSSFCVAPIRGV